MKTALVTIALLSTLLSISQEDQFIVTENGLRNSADTSKTYIVLTLDSSASYLYNRSLQYIQQTYKNPDLITKAKIENEYLRFDTYTSSFIVFSIKKQKFPINVEYSVELKFRDGKLRIEFSQVKMKADNDVPLYWVKTGSSFKGWSRQHIYDTDGRVEHQNEKKQIEDYFNNEIRLLKEFIIKKEKW